MGVRIRLVLRLRVWPTGGPSRSQLEPPGGAGVGREATPLEQLIRGVSRLKAQVVSPLDRLRRGETALWLRGISGALCRDEPERRLWERGQAWVGGRAAPDVAQDRGGSNPRLAQKLESRQRDGRVEIVRDRLGGC